LLMCQGDIELDARRKIRPTSAPGIGEKRS
jgi:hypothetical protein